MAMPPHGNRDDGEEPTDPMLDDPPGRGPSRPSLAPSLAMRISEVPRTTPGRPERKTQLQLVMGGGLLIILALGVLIFSRAMTQGETVHVLSVPLPEPVPDPEPSAVAPSPEPVPDPAPTIEAEITPSPTPSGAAEPGTVSDDEPRVVDETPPEHLAVIVSKDNPVNTLSAEEIRRIYLEDRHWADGRIAKPVGRYQAPALRRIFLELVLGTNHQAIKQHWEEKKSEGLERVRRLPSDEEVIQYVAKRPEALGYVDWAKLTPEAREKVKLVFEIRLQ